MRELKDNELLEINGGVSITASFLNAASRLIDTILELGRCVGTAIVRSKTKNYCIASR